MNLDRLKSILGDCEFRVKYTVENVVTTSPTPECVDTFLTSDFPKGDGTLDDLERNFFAWCVQEDGCDFYEQEAPVVLEIQPD